MNIHEYKQLVYDFFTLIFSSGYIKVSVPFVIIISLFIWLTTSYYYKLKINHILQKQSHELILLQNRYSHLNSSTNQNDINSLELYPSLSNYYNIYQVPSAPPQYIVQQSDIRQV